MQPATPARRALRFLAPLLALVAVLPGAALAQTEKEPQLSDEDKQIVEAYKNIEWVVGPGTGDLGNAKIKIPQGYRFAGADGAKAFCDYTGNSYNGELGVLTPPVDPKKKKDNFPQWFIFFTFSDEGYVKDDDKGDLNDKTAENLLKGFQEATNQENAARTARGWPALSVTGWNQKPFYDETTKNLTWAIVVASEGERSVNYDSRVLGRRGFMTVKMVLDEDQVSATVPQYRKIIGGLTFNPGESYSEYRDGDKLAKYGLVGLLSGGAAVAAIKWWKPLMKFGIFIVAGIGLAIKKILSMFRGAPAAG